MPQCIVIKGDRALEGDITVSGGKNTSVAAIPATLLCDEPCVIENLPDIEDVRALRDILIDLGADVDYLPGVRMTVDPRPAKGWQVSETNSHRLRASYYLLGALLGRCGQAEVYVPGGCSIGARPIDQHERGFIALGARIERDESLIRVQADELVGCEFTFDIVTVGGTINVMLAACKAQGTTIIHNAAKEPHIVDLANFLNLMGAHIRGAGTETIRIKGVPWLHRTTYSVIPDQIETGTLMIAAAATHGKVSIHGCIPTHMEALTAKLLEMGVRVQELDDMITVSEANAHRSVKVKTQVYPGFPTDLQQPMSALMTTARGESSITETIFENRFMHMKELRRMGAQIREEGNTAYITGVEQIYGAPVVATDLRAGAALLVAGLMARGETQIFRPDFIDRGYEHIEEKLSAIGADIHRTELDWPFAEDLQGGAP